VERASNSSSSTTYLTLEARATALESAFLRPSERTVEFFAKTLPKEALDDAGRAAVVAVDELELILVPPPYHALPVVPKTWTLRSLTRFTTPPAVFKRNPLASPVHDAFHGHILGVGR